jgi:hypothetical protein
MMKSSKSRTSACLTRPCVAMCCPFHEPARWLREQVGYPAARMGSEQVDEFAGLQVASDGLQAKSGDVLRVW